MHPQLPQTRAAQLQVPPGPAPRNRYTGCPRQLPLRPGRGACRSREKRQRKLVALRSRPTRPPDAQAQPGDVAYRRFDPRLRERGQSAASVIGKGTSKAHARHYSQQRAAGGCSERRERLAQVQITLRVVVLALEKTDLTSGEQLKAVQPKYPILYANPHTHGVVQVGAAEVLVVARARAAIGAAAPGAIGVPAELVKTERDAPVGSGRSRCNRNHRRNGGDGNRRYPLQPDTRITLSIIAAPSECASSPRPLGHNAQMRFLPGRTWIALVAVLLVAADTWADEWSAPPLADPLRMASLPLDVAAARPLGAGEWVVETALAYFNVASESWHTGTVHRELGREGLPLEAWELRLLEKRHPEDEIYRVDVEGWRSDLAVSVGLGVGLAASLRLGRVGVGTPQWDAVADDFHSAFGLGGGRRVWFARGQSVVYVRGHDRTVESWNDLERDSWTDTTLSLSGSGGDWLGADHRWVVALEAPTGDRETLAGSGGWDTGLRWIATWGSKRRVTRAAFGYTFLDGGGGFLGARRADTWHVLGELRRPLSSRIDWRMAARFDASPLADLTALDPGAEAFFLTLGAAAPIGRTGWLSFDLGENYPIRGVAPDFTFHLQFGAHLRGGDR